MEVRLRMYATASLIFLTFQRFLVIFGKEMAKGIKISICLIKSCSLRVYDSCSPFTALLN